MADFVPNEANAGSNVYQWHYWGGTQQEWQLEFVSQAPPVGSRPAECMGFPPNTFYHMIAKHSGLALRRMNPSNIVQDVVHPTSARDRWRMVSAGDGHYLIMNGATGLAMSRKYRFAVLVLVPGTNKLDLSFAVDGTNLVETSPDATSEWCFAAVGDGYYSIRNRASGDSIDVQNWSFEPLGNVGTWGYYGGANQEFLLELAVPGGPLPPPIAPTQPPTPPPNTDHLSMWKGPYGTPVVGVALANFPNGKILFWSAYMREVFDYDTGSTWTALYDPSTDDLSELLVSNTQHGKDN